MRYLNILLLTLLVGTIAFWIEGCGLNEESVTGSPEEENQGLLRGTVDSLLEESPSEGPYAKDATLPLGKISLISKEKAYKVILHSGLDPAEIRYFDVVPFDKDGDNDFEMAWVAVVLSKNKLLGTFVDPQNGELLAHMTSLHEGLEAHLIDLGIKDGGPHTMRRDHYENYPWGYDLPTPFGNHALTCGYGCGYHTGSNYYAVDLDTYDRECVPAPASGYVMYAGGNRNTGYGLQVIVRGMPLGNNRYYIYRIAHFDEIWVTPGWWVDKNRTLGLAGCTGWCSGSHVHFSIHRGYYAGHGRISGESLPLDRWPGPNDRVDYFDRYQYWQFSFNVCR